MLRSRVTSQQNTNRDAEELVAENARQRELVTYLADSALPTAGMVRTMRALYATLPDSLWVREVDLVAGRGQGGPVVEVIGQGKELHGIDVSSVYEQFSADFRAHPLVPRDPDQLKAQPRPTGAGEGIEFSFEIDYRGKSGEDR